jgi:hypothetical protein
MMMNKDPKKKKTKQNKTKRERRNVNKKMMIEIV